jgi:hypothetical protein
MIIKFRKRVVLTAILTLLTLFLTRNIWLEKKPITAEFEIKNAKNSTVEVLINKKFDDEFLPCRTKKSSAKINSNKLHNIVIKINTSAEPMSPVRITNPMGTIA